MKTALVVGSGFEGLACAHYLRDVYQLEVTLIDSAPSIGGVMRGFSVGSFHYDFGCQVFDNFDARVSRAIVALSGHECEFDDITYGGRFGGKMTTDVSVPDLTSLDPQTIAKIETEVQETRQDGLNAHTLADYFQRRWGTTAATILERISTKMLDAPAAELDQSSRIYAGLNRLKVFRDDDQALKLKKADPLMDAKVAVPRATAAFYEKSQQDIPFQNIIPVPRSFGGFCETARHALTTNGINFQLDTRLEGLEINPDTQAAQATGVTKSGEQIHVDADLVVWCAPFEQLCDILDVNGKTAEFLSPIGTTITYFVAPRAAINPLGYMQNYDADMRFFRWSSMGLYSRQVTPDGLSFCCIETPSQHSADTDTPQAEALRDWEDLRALDLVSGQPAQPPMRKFIPGVIKRRRPGYTAAAAEAMQKLALQTGSAMVYQKPDSFGRTPTARTLFDEIDVVMS